MQYSSISYNSEMSFSTGEPNPLHLFRLFHFQNNPRAASIHCAVILFALKLRGAVVAKAFKLENGIVICGGHHVGEL